MKPRRSRLSRPLTQLGSGTCQEARNNDLAGARSVFPASKPLQGAKHGFGGSQGLCGRQSFWIKPNSRLVACLSPNARSQSHWPKTSARSQIMQHTALAAKAQGLRPASGPVIITFRWVFHDRRTRDIDNLAGNGTVKAVLDALVRAHYLVDDSTQFVADVHTIVAYEMGSRYIEIVLEEL